MVVMQDFIDRLHKYMRDNDLSQVEFSKKIGCTKAYISMLLAGKRNPSSNFMERLAAKTNLPSSYWLHGDSKSDTLDNLNKLINMLLDNGMIDENGEMDDNIKNMLDSMLKAEIATKVENRRKK